MNRLMMVFVVLGAVAATGCALFQPAMRCSMKSVPLYWADGTIASMSIQVCGYDWKVRK